MIETQLTCNYDQFIGSYENIYPDGFCEHIIEEFERIRTTEDLVRNRQQEQEGVPKLNKDDEFLFLQLDCVNMYDWKGQQVQRMIWKGLQTCYDHYTDRYDILKSNNLLSDCLKMQKTNPGQGYHIWHAEDLGRTESSRILAWSLYLNDVEDAGETEFLYLQKRYKPKKNSLIIWPSGFTHTHRGNVVHGNKSKYIITGWFYLV